MGAGLKKGLAGLAVLVLLVAAGVLLRVGEPQRAAPAEVVEIERPATPYRSKIVPVEMAGSAPAGHVATPPPARHPVAGERRRERIRIPLKLEERTSMGRGRDRRGRMESVAPRVTSLKLKQSTSISSREGLSRSWAIRLGSFRSDSSANYLREQLQGAGFASFIATEQVDGHTATRVYVGPERSRRDAKRVLAQLQERQNLKGVIVEHQL